MTPTRTVRRHVFGDDHRIGVVLGGVEHMLTVDEAADLADRLIAEAKAVRAGMASARLDRLERGAWATRHAGEPVHRTRGAKTLCGWTVTSAWVLIADAPGPRDSDVCAACRDRQRQTGGSGLSITSHVVSKT